MRLWEAPVGDFWEGLPVKRLRILKICIPSVLFHPDACRGLLGRDFFEIHAFLNFTLFNKIYSSVSFDFHVFK